MGVISVLQMKRGVLQTYKTQPFESVIRSNGVHAPYKYIYSCLVSVVTAHESHQQTPDKIFILAPRCLKRRIFESIVAQ